MTKVDQPSQPRTSLLQAGVFFAAIAAIVTLFASISIGRIWAHDFWWQYATGRVVAQSGPPQQDVFSYTVRGAPWIELRWLYCWLLYEVFEHLGPAIVSLSAFALSAVAFTLLVAPVLRPPKIAAAAVTLFLAVMAVSPRMLVRPELVTYLLLAIYLRIIERYRRRGGRLIYVIPLLQIVWVNSHTLFAFGPGLVGLLLFDILLRRTLKRGPIPRLGPVVVVLILTLAACAVNPYGVRSIPFAIQLLHQIHGTVYKDTILEFRSPFAYGPSFTAVLAFELLLGLTFLGACVNLRRADSFWAALTLVMAYLACVSIRNIPLFCLVATPFTITNLQDCRLWTHPLVAAVRAPLASVISLAVIGVSVYVVQRVMTNRFLINESDPRQFGVGIAAHHNPVRAERILADAHVAGHVFCTFAESPYLIAQGVPVFTDGRLEVYGPEVFSQYLRIVETDAGWREADAQYNFQAAILNLESRLINQLWSDPNWRLIGFDEVAAVFVRNSIPHPPPALRTSADVRPSVDAIRQSLPAPPAYEALKLFDSAVSPLPYQRVGGFLLALGFSDLAEPFVADAIRAFPEAALAHKYHGQILEARGDLAGAIAEYERALPRLPDDADLLLRLANQYMTASQPDRARPLVAKALSIAPQNPRAWALQAALLAAENRWPEAVQHMQKAVDLEPANNDFRTFLEVMRRNAAPR